MHSMIQKLFEANKIQVSSRVCGGDPIFQPVWNGQDLALYWLKVQYNNDDEIISTENIPLSDHDLLHEIAHWIAAAPEQRDLPEYGLGPIAFRTYHIANIPSVVDSEENSIQEHLCWLLCCYWGMKYQISPKLSSEPKYVSTWEEYLNKKIKENLTRYNPKIMWEALIRFRNLLDAGSIF